VQVSDDPRVGTELAGCRIESLLGLGGMSVVYLAEDLRLKRRVALKLLAASLAEDESFRDRFLRESELAASIDHPNIIPIYEAGKTDDLLFIAMRYVEGRDMKERLQRGCLDPRDAIGILAQVASALDAAHARGLVHRDVKPSNVLLDTGARPDGSDHVYLADFGLTKRVVAFTRNVVTGVDPYSCGHRAPASDVSMSEPRVRLPLPRRSASERRTQSFVDCLGGL